jgi:hypothetical protein
MELLHSSGMERFHSSGMERFHSILMFCWDKKCVMQCSIFCLLLSLNLICCPKPEWQEKNKERSVHFHLIEVDREKN